MLQTEHIIFFISEGGVSPNLDQDMKLWYTLVSKVIKLSRFQKLLKGKYQVLRKVPLPCGVC
jgi:hypothetical protein